MNLRVPDLGEMKANPRDSALDSCLWLGTGPALPPGWRGKRSGNLGLGKETVACIDIRRIVPADYSYPVTARSSAISSFSEEMAWAEQPLRIPMATGIATIWIAPTIASA